MLVCGAGMGAVFDFYNTILGAIRLLRRMRGAVDLVFWLVSGLIVYFFTYRTISGTFRIWTFLLLIVGYLIYRAALRKVVIGSAFAVLRITRLIALGIAKFVYVMVGVPMIWLFRLVFAILKLLYAIGQRLENGVARLVLGVALVLLFPFRRYLKPDRLWRKKLREAEKGFWDWVSKLLQKKPGSVS